MDVDTLSPPGAAGAPPPTAPVEAPAAPPPAPDAPDGAPDGAAPHPLAPGGVRFEQVIAEKNAAKAAAVEAAARAAALEARLAALEPAKAAAPARLTPDQLQAAVDAGTLTTLQGAALLARQEAEAAAERRAAASAAATRATTAETEIADYVAAAPALQDSTSADFRRVAEAAREIAAEWGRTVNDPLVQRRALRQELGPLARLTERQTMTEASRRAADPGVTAGGGGGAAASGGAPADPLKGLPPAYVAFWRRQGLTDAQIAADAQYLTPTARARLVAAGR